KPAAAPAAVAAPAAQVSATPPADDTAGGQSKLPKGREAVIGYFTSSYKGVGQKTAESLYGEFGDRVFEALQNEPARVRELLGDRRAGTLLEQWEADPRKPTGRAARSPRGRAAAKKPAAGKAAPEA